jgi:hypothetical protein
MGFFEVSIIKRYLLKYFIVYPLFRQQPVTGEKLQSVSAFRWGRVEKTKTK